MTSAEPEEAESTENTASFSTESAVCCLSTAPASQPMRSPSRAGGCSKFRRRVNLTPRVAASAVGCPCCRGGCSRKNGRCPDRHSLGRRCKGARQVLRSGAPLVLRHHSSHTD